MVIHVWQVRDVVDGDVQVDGYVLIAGAVYASLCAVRELRKLVPESFSDADVFVSECVPYAIIHRRDGDILLADGQQSDGVAPRPPFDIGLPSNIEHIVNDTHNLELVFITPLLPGSSQLVLIVPHADADTLVSNRTRIERLRRRAYWNADRLTRLRTSQTR